MLLYVFVAIAGGFLAAAAIVPYGPLAAIVSVPLGGSLCAALAALAVMQLRGHGFQSEEELDAQTDAIVTSLRGVIAQAQRQEPVLPEAERPKRRA